MTHPTEQALRVAIIESPHDMTPRMALADWLMERGNPEGEFIALQLRCPERGDREMCRKFAAGPCRWCSDASEMLSGTVGDLRRWKWFGKQFDCNLIVPEFRSGLVEVVYCTKAVFLAHGPALVRAAPLLSVDLSQSCSPQLIDGAWFWFFTDATDSPANLPRFLAAYFIEESFDNGEAAMHALSAGILQWAREEAGLER